MKKVLLSLAVLALGASAASAATIVGSKHDLSVANTGKGQIITNSTQVCVFCHTPHNAVVNKLLWNRSLPSTTYQFFTSSNISAAMRTVLKGSQLNSNSSSVLCLSCHDRQVSELLTDMGPSRGGATSITDQGGNWANYAITNDQGKTGNLTNDHPIGFSYAAAQALNTQFLYDATQATTNMANGSIFFSGAGGVTDAMECASCHMTHDPSNGKFLRKTQVGSAICLACHIK